MTEIRRRRVRGWGTEAGDCAFCFLPVQQGAAWLGVIDLFACADCVRAGKLGCLIGDGLDDAGEIRAALEVTAEQAYRARALAERAGREHAR